MSRATRREFIKQKAASTAAAAGIQPPADATNLVTAVDDTITHLVKSTV